MDYVYQFTLLIEPFLYGALGSSIYLLRKSEQFLKTREFDPGRISEHWNRLILGALCGGSIILFITGVESDDGNLLQISAAALGFLAGYSVDFLFKTADRIIEAILPKVGLTTAQLKRRAHETNEIISHYEDLLKSTKDEKQQKFISEKLQTWLNKIGVKPLHICPG